MPTDAPSDGAHPIGRTSGRWGMVLCLVAVSVLLLAMPVGRPLAPALGVPLCILLVMGVALAWIAGHRFVGLLPVALFGALGMISCLQSTYPEQSWARSSTGLVLMLVFPAAQVIAASILARRVIVTVVTIVIVVTAGDIAAQASVGSSLLLGVPRETGGLRFAGSLPNPNECAFVAILAPIAVMGVEASMAWRTASVARQSLALVGALVALLLSGGRANFGGLLFGSLCAGFLQRRRSLLLVAAVVVVAGTGAFALDLASVRTRISEFARLLEEPRIRTWSIAWTSFLESPWLGQGPGVFFEINEASRLGAEKRGWLTPAGGMPWVHSMLLEMLCERGVAGFTAAVLIIVSCTRGLRRGLAQSSTKRWSAAVAGAAVAYCTIALVDLSLLKDWCAVLTWLIAGLAVAADRAASESTQTGSQAAA